MVTGPTGPTGPAGPAVPAKPSVPEASKPEKPKVQRPATDLSPKFTFGAIMGVAGIIVVAIVNSMAELGIEPKGFVAMGLTLLTALTGVYARAGDGR